MKHLVLDKKLILEFQNNVDPYLMIDHAEKVVPGKMSEGYKILDKNDWYFKAHWKNDPNLPGMLQIEALLQMSSLAILTLPGNKKKFLYLTSASKLKFIKKITPEYKKFYLKTKVKSFKRGLAFMTGEGFLNNYLACSAEFCLVLPDDLKKFKMEK